MRDVSLRTCWVLYDFVSDHDFLVGPRHYLPGRYNLNISDERKTTTRLDYISRLRWKESINEFNINPQRAFRNSLGRQPDRNHSKKKIEK